MYKLTFFTFIIYNNVTTSDYALPSDMGQAQSAFYVVKPSVGLNAVVASRAQVVIVFLIFIQSQLIKK